MSDTPNTGHEVTGGAPATKLRPWINILAVVALVGLVALLLWPATSSGPVSRRGQCRICLLKIGLALATYQDTYHTLPPAFTVDANGKPLHSWRTLILPFTDHSSVYSKIDLTKPWDDPANAEACQTAIDFYHCPAARCAANHTTYLAIVTADSCIQKHRSQSLDQIDRPAETVLIIEVSTDRSIPWMAPIDVDKQSALNFSSESKLAHSHGVNAEFADGSVRFLSNDMSAAERRALIPLGQEDKADSSP